MNAPPPQNVQQLKAFLVLLNYYRKFMSNLSTVIHLLNYLLRHDFKWRWTLECRKSFEKAKELLKHSNVLPSLPIKL